MLTVIAKDASSAMDEIISKLGSDAMIVATRKVEKGVEVTATSDPLLLHENLRVKSNENILHTSQNNGVQAKIIELPVEKSSKNANSVKRKILSTLDHQLDELLSENTQTQTATTPWETLKRALGGDQNFKEDLRANNLKKEMIIEKFARLLTRFDFGLVESADEIYVVGDTGVGKSTIVGKLAFVLGQSPNPAEAILIETNKHKYIEHSILQTVASVLGKQYNQGADNLFHTDCVIKEINTNEFLEDRSYPSAENKQVIFLVLPAGLSTKTYTSVLSKFRNYKIQIVLTKIDEYDIELEDMFVFYNANATIALLSASPDISDGVCVATEQVLSGFIKQKMDG
jgi:flagellar biosynthesis GTPase FlhF